MNRGVLYEQRQVYLKPVFLEAQNKTDREFCSGYRMLFDAFIRKLILSLADYAPRIAKAGINIYVKFCKFLKKMPTPLCLYTANRLGYGVQVTCSLDHGMIMAVLLNDKIGKAIYRSGKIEPETTRMLRCLLRDDTVFFDIGANVGYFTLLAASIITSGSIHCFEPNPRCYAMLKNNIRTNALINVQTNSCALSDRSGSAQLYLALLENSGATSLNKPVFEYSGKEITVDTTTLDTYMSAKDIQHVDIMKIDVEGAELRVLQGALSLLTSGDKPVLIIEFYEHAQVSFGTSCRELADFLIGHGYTLYIIDDTGSALLTLWEYNYNKDMNANILAIPDDRVGNIMQSVRSCSGVLSGTS